MKALRLPCLLVALILTVACQTTSVPTVEQLAQSPAAPMSMNPYCGLTPPTVSFPACPGLDFTCANNAYNAYVAAYEMASDSACLNWDHGYNDWMNAFNQITVEFQDCVALAAQQGVSDAHCYSTAEAAYAANDLLWENTKISIGRTWSRTTADALSTFNTTVQGCCP